jgi:phosphoribosylglycinamide formyltransferase-1
VKVSGATVHLVDEVADGGPILSQQAIEVLDDDTPSSLGRRILEQVEWKLLPKTVASYCLYMERNMSLSQKLAECRYPGRGIVCGMNESGKAIIAYFITARSIHSKNRALVAEGDTVRTKAVDESLLVDPSLIIYRVMDSWATTWWLPTGTKAIPFSMACDEAWICSNHCRAVR